MTNYPHVPAAFINAIAEEGTKAEAIEWLQKTWNELCATRAALKPFADCVFYDNGDVTVSHTAKSEDYTRAFFLLRKSGE